MSHELPVGTRVTIRSTGREGWVERTHNAVEFAYDLRLQDGTLLPACTDYWYQVPSVLTPIAEIPDLLSVETGQPVGARPGWAFIDFYIAQPDEDEIRWRKYRERYPLDGWGVLWEQASAEDGRLNEQEQAAWAWMDEQRRTWSTNRKASQ